MSWIVLSLLSAFLHGFYDLAKKHAVHGNAVLPVLFFSTLSGALVWGGLILFDTLSPDTLSSLLVVQEIGARGHTLLFLKSVLVSASWICTYAAVKHLPVSLSSPVRATGPVWTLVGALVLLGERPAPLEYLGVAITLASFVALSFAGRRDGVTFHKDKWIGWMLAGTLLGAASGLYDRHLLSNLGYTAATVQAWFSIYLAVVFFPLVIGWQRRWWPRNEFHWRWTIPWIGLILLAADFLYFAALQQPDAMIALVSSLRRGSVLVTFGGGMLLFGEKHGRAKLPAVIGILIGILITTLG